MAKKASKKTKKQRKKVAARGKRYTPAQRARLLKRFTALRARGVTVMEAAKQIGVPYITLHNWEKKAGIAPAKKKAKPGREPGRKPGRPRKAIPGKKAARRGRKGHLQMTLADGSFIEGITTKDLIAIVKAVNLSIE